MVPHIMAGDEYRDISFEKLLDLSLPYAVISYEGEVFVAKTVGSGGILNYNTCAEQLLYEVGDPSAYITPDVVSMPLNSCHHFHTIVTDYLSFFCFFVLFFFLIFIIIIIILI